MGDFPRERDEPRWLSDDEQQTWRSFWMVALLIDEQFARTFYTDSGISTADFRLLSPLSEAPGHELRAGALARVLYWTPGRTSRAVARMESRGLVERLPDPDDRRGVIVRATDTGMTLIRDAAPLHVERVRELFVERLDEDQLRTVQEIFGPLRAELERDYL